MIDLDYLEKIEKNILTNPTKHILKNVVPSIGYARINNTINSIKSSIKIPQTVANINFAYKDNRYKNLLDQMKAEESILGHSENRIEKYRQKLLDAAEKAYNAQGLKEHIDYKVKKPLRALNTINLGLNSKINYHLHELQNYFPNKIVNRNIYEQQTNPFSDTELIATLI